MRKFASLKKQLNLYQKIARDNYRGERTIIVLAGLNFRQTELKATPHLAIYEEKFLFFLFLLRFARTRIIYVVSKPIQEYLINYYLDIISDKPQDKKDMWRRLIIVNLNSIYCEPVARKLLRSSAAIKKIESYIFNYKTTYIRCYNSTDYEKQVALKLGVPLYGVDSKLSFFGSKSGSIYTFRKNKVPCVNNYINLKNEDDLVYAILKLIKKNPHQQKLIIKIEDFPAGEGNVIFSIDKLKKYLKNKDLVEQKNLPELVKRYLYKCCEQSEKLSHKRFSYHFPTVKKYFEEFEKSGGVVELYLEGKEKYSPSCQVRILPNKKIMILSTHEQVLSGRFKTEYAGCFFPARKEYRREITLYSYKIAKYLAGKGVIGRFAVDFVALKQTKRSKFKLYAIEINLRKGGTTHPYELARSATGALYYKKNGLLFCGRKKIYYFATDNLTNKKWAGHGPKKLVAILEQKKLNFDRDSKEGVIVHLFGFLQKDGRFGATFIATSPKRVNKLYQRTLKILNKYLK